MSDFRGSKRHMLEWIDQPQFAAEFSRLLDSSGVSIKPDAPHLPLGTDKPREARLETFGPKAFPDVRVWQELRNWWLPAGQRGNTPNWDFASLAQVSGGEGLVLVEAKANVRELSRAGKSVSHGTEEAPRPADSIRQSEANQAQLGLAVSQASSALGELQVTKPFGIASHYQLANRIAFLWKLTSLGVPTTLVYLGFTGDSGLEAALRPFSDTDEWLSAFREYSAPILVRPGADFTFRVGETEGRFLVRARRRLSESPALPRT